MRDLLIGVGYCGTSLFIVAKGSVLLVWPHRHSLLGRVRGVTESNVRKVGIAILVAGLVMFFLPLIQILTK